MPSSSASTRSGCPSCISGGPKAIHQVGRLGLPYLASFAESLQQLRENYALHRESTPDGVDAEKIAVPIMRSLFLTHDGGAAARVREALDRQANELRGSLPRAAAPVADWALVGSPGEVADGLAIYREQLGLTHLIVSAHVPGASPSELERSLELIAGLR
jgi:alkanesulfonate monooxygenase SsuD/methylene tetrahydromethanopterin reductase-like flavin-dependent oxidoreductase (luciferase family)